MQLNRIRLSGIHILLPLLLLLLPVRIASAQEGHIILTGDVLIMLEDYSTYSEAVASIELMGLMQPIRSPHSGLIMAGMPEDLRENLTQMNMSQHLNRAVSGESEETLQRVSLLLRDLRNLEIVKHAEADFIEFNTSMSVPSDQYYHASDRFPLGQWALSSSEPYGINADIAWDKARGKGKIIAILDNGFTLAHGDLTDVAFFYDVVDHPPAPPPDFEDKRYLLMGQQYANFRTRLVPTGDWQGPDYGWENEFFHGIACSGVAAARMDNAGYGITGVAPEADLGMIRISATYTAVRQIRPDATETWEDIYPTGHYHLGVRYSNVIEAIYRAVPVLTNPEKCARVINMSWGLEGVKPCLEEDADESLLKEAINHAHSLHCVVIAATGNNGAPEIRLPARFENVLAVGATTRSGRVLAESNYGDSVDCVAPGDSIIVTMNLEASPVDEVAQAFGATQYLNRQGPGFIADFGEFTYQSGTSFSTAIVSGAVAVLQSYLIESEAYVIRDLLTSTAHPTLDHPEKDGNGLIDLAAALEAATIKNVQAELTERPGGGKQINLSWNAHTIFEFDRYDSLSPPHMTVFG